MITLRGIVLVVGAILLYLLARLTQVSWLYMADALLWGTVFVSLIAPWISVTGLLARRRLLGHTGAPSPWPAEEDDLQIELQLESHRFWPRLLVTASYECPLASPEAQLQRFFLPGLAGRGSVTVSSNVRCYRRGLHQLGLIVVESRAPFGLFRQRRRLAAPLSVLVYPRVFPLKRLPLLESARDMSLPTGKSLQGQEIAGSRRYFPGDPVRHIHWRNTARVGRPMVRQFEGTQDNSVLVVFDSSQELGQGRETTMEYSVKLAASVARCVTDQGGSVRLLTGRLSSESMPWDALLKELALLKAGTGPRLPELVDSMPSAIPVLAILTNGDLQGAQALLRRAGAAQAMLAIVLDGFGEPDEPVGAVARLQEAGVPTIICRMGDLPSTLESLRQLTPLSAYASGRTRIGIQA